MIKDPLKVVLEAFEAEQKGDIEKGLSLLSEDYSMTWMNISRNGQILRRISGRENAKKIMKQVYKILDREYKVKNTAVSGNIVFIEFIESYQDPKTGKEFVTPVVGVYSVEGSKIKWGRHYADDNISYAYLDLEVVEQAILK